MKTPEERMEELVDKLEKKIIKLQEALRKLHEAHLLHGNMYTDLTDFIDIHDPDYGLEKDDLK